jgi:hypothetical protein
MCVIGYDHTSCHLLSCKLDFLLDGINRGGANACGRGWIVDSKVKDPHICDTHARTVVVLVAEARSQLVINDNERTNCKRRRANVAGVYKCILSIKWGKIHGPPCVGIATWCDFLIVTQPVRAHKPRTPLDRFVVEQVVQKIHNKSNKCVEFELERFHWITWVMGSSWHAYSRHRYAVVSIGHV